MVLTVWALHAFTPPSCTSGTLLYYEYVTEWTAGGRFLVYLRQLANGHIWAPSRYIDWVNAHLGFNPRSGKQSVALSEYMLDDLRFVSSALDEALRAGRLRAQFDPLIATRFMEKNLDLALLDVGRSGPNDLLGQVAAPSSGRAQLLAEHKAIMTAHGKQRKNRISDIGGYVSHIHNHAADAVAGFTVVINVSPEYRNPDAWASGIVRNYTNMAHIVRSTVELFTGVPLREAVTDSYELPEGVGVILVDYDGIHEARLVTDPPAPQPGAPTCWETFVRQMAQKWEERFG
jgi:hypothetical protein